jgi:hypothetical protein
MKYLVSLVGLVVLLLNFISFASINKLDDKPNTPTNLKLDQEAYLTDVRGVFNLRIFGTLEPNSTVKIYFPDGKVLVGIVKTTEMFNNELFKVFGEITNETNTGFGFAVTKNGILGGAVVYRDTQVNYVVKYIEDLKGYILIPDKLQGKSI